MKFQITESCLIRGTHAQAGEIVDITDVQAAALYQAGRGFPIVEGKSVVEAPTTPAEEPAVEAKPKGKK